MHDRHASSLWCEENILHTARSTPNTAFLHDVFGNVTNATDTAGNALQFSYTHNSTLTNEVFTSPCLRDSVCQTNALLHQVDSYSRPIGYDLAIGDTPCSRMRYGYDTEGRVATLAATNAANRGFQVEYLNESGYNYGYTLTTPNGATLTRTVTRDPYRRSLTLDCITRFNNVVVASFAYTFDAHNRPVARNNDRFAYNDRDEVLSATIGTNRIEHAYDTIGNHVFLAYNSATNFYANNQLNQTTASYACVPTTDSGNNDTPPLFAGRALTGRGRDGCAHPSACGGRHGLRGPVCGGGRGMPTHGLMRRQRFPFRQTLPHHQNQSHQTYPAYAVINPIKPIWPITGDRSHPSDPSYRSQKQKPGIRHCMMGALLFSLGPMGPIGRMGPIFVSGPDGRDWMDHNGSYRFGDRIDFPD